MAGIHFQRATLKLSVAETTQWRHFLQKKIKEKLITALNYSGRSVIFISDPLYKVLVEPSDKNVQQKRNKWQQRNCTTIVQWSTAIQV